MIGPWRSLAGMLEAELTSADPGAALGVINSLGIALFDVVQRSDLCVRFRVYRSDYPKLKALAARRGERLLPVRRLGAYWDLKRLLHRPVLLFGAAVLFILATWLPSRVLFIQVEGNALIPAQKIVEEAAKCGVCFGASRREVRSERMKNALLGAIPQLQWAGINTRGCLAVISVRERTDVEVNPAQSGKVCSIVAARDGVIQSCTVFRGNALCKVGQAVKAGQVLVSGYSDYGICIRATQAEAEIFALTRRELIVRTPGSMDVRTDSTHTERRFSLLIGKKRINFYKGSGIADGSCVRMYEEYYVTLPGGFRLPVALAVERRTYYASSPQTNVPPEEFLKDFARRYLEQQMIAGQVLSRTEEVTSTEEETLLAGEYACLEMIALPHIEEDLPGYGKTD